MAYDSEDPWCDALEWLPNLVHPKLRGHVDDHRFVPAESADQVKRAIAETLGAR